VSSRGSKEGLLFALKLWQRWRLTARALPSRVWLAGAPAHFGSSACDAGLLAWDSLCVMASMRSMLLAFCAALLFALCFLLSASW